MLDENTGAISRTPNLVVLFANEVQQNTSTTIAEYGVHNPKLVELCADPTFQSSLSDVLRGVALMPIYGFSGTFPWLCGAGSVLIRLLIRLQTHTDKRTPSSLKGAFLCGEAPITMVHATQYHHARQSFLIHAGLSIVGAHGMGRVRIYVYTHTHVYYGVYICIQIDRRKSFSPRRGLLYLCVSISRAGRNRSQRSAR